MMVLPWVMNYNTMKLTCNIGADLEYEALEGGLIGYNKKYRRSGTDDFIESFVPNNSWELEKRWISDNFSDIVGVYEPESNKDFRINSRGTYCSHGNGTDPDGARLDHMQRPQALMEAEDCASIWCSSDYCEYESPDRGLTIYVRLAQPGENTNYADKEGMTWTDVPQACHMQPRIQGRKLVTYQQLLDAGCPASIVEKCQAGEWDAPKRPDLQQFYVYPTA